VGTWKKEEMAGRQRGQVVPTIFSPLSSLLFCPEAIIFLKGQRRSIIKRKEHLATSYGGAGNHRVLMFIGSPVIYDAIFATSAQFMR